jgi:outer membrane protein TolC
MSEAAAPRRWRAGTRRRAAALVVLALALTTVAQAQVVDLADAALAAVAGPDVHVATLQWQQAEAAARIAAQVVSGSLRTGASASASTVAGSGGLDTSIQPLSLQATLYVVPVGPTHDAAVRAQRAAEDARAAVHAAASQAVIDAADAYWAAERAQRESHAAEARLDAAERALDAIRVQLAAGTAGVDAVADAEIAFVQARLDAATAAVERDAALLDLAQLIGSPVTGVAPRSDGGADLAEAWLLDLTLPDQATLDAAAAIGARVRSAQDALADALASADRARSDAGPSASLSANVALSGDAGRVALGGGIDTRASQPTVDLSLDPFSNAPAGLSASVSLTVTVPIASARAATVERADLVTALESERLAQAHVQSSLDLTAAVRAVEQAAGQLRITLDRLALRTLQLEASEVRHAAGTVSPLDLERARRELVDAELALDRALDAARLARARLALAIDDDPFAALGIDAATRDNLHALMEGVVEVP